MVYLIIASVLCGIAAASQAGGSVVLLSIIVTYGGKSRGIGEERFADSVSDVLERELWSRSVCVEQPTRVRSVASLDKFRAIPVVDPDVPLHLEHVRPLFLMKRSS